MIKSSKFVTDKRNSYRILICICVNNIATCTMCSWRTRTAFLRAINYISVSTDCKWPFRYGERGNERAIARHREFAMMIGGGGQGKGQFE